MSRRIGYARPTNERDRTLQRSTLEGSGVASGNVFLDDPAQRSRPELRAALAACRPGDIFVVPTLRALGSTVREVHRTTTVLHAHGVRLDVGGTVFDPGKPVGEMFFTTIALLAGVEHTPTPPRRNPAPTKSNVTSIKTGNTRRRNATGLDEQDEQELIRLHATGDYTATELAARFRVSRSTVYRITERHAREHRN